LTKRCLRTESRIATDGASHYLTDLSHRFIWWQCKDDVTKLADQVQRIQIRRIERDVFETEELTRRCLRLLSGGGDDVGDRSGGSDGSDSDGGGGGLRRRRRRSGVGGGDGGGSVKVRKSTSLPPVGRRARSVGGREAVVEEREAVKVRGDTTATNGEQAPAAGRRDRRGSRYRILT
jgi:hypothetical protein